VVLVEREKDRFPRDVITPLSVPSFPNQLLYSSNPSFTEVHHVNGNMENIQTMENIQKQKKVDILGGAEMIHATQ